MMNWCRRVMMGRRGVDQLSVALMICYLVFGLVAQITHLLLFLLLSFVPLIWAFYRIFSRNLSKRYQENNKFMQWWSSVVNWCKNKKYRLVDRKTHRYYKCPNCSNTLRVPKGKGKICITCPVCRKEFIKKT